MLRHLCAKAFNDKLEQLVEAGNVNEAAAQWRVEFAISSDVPK